MPDRRLDASALHDWAHTAVGDLLRHADEINRLNVFPVADADTGTNMAFTMRSALSAADPAVATGDVAEVAAALARGALDGARGNSGVILSQILRSLAEVTAEASADTDPADTGLADIGPALLGAALRHAVVLVVSAMGGEVVAGTVVSVLQAAAEAAESRAADGVGLPQVLTAAAEAAATALDRTPDQLPVLAEAGVVDAGGRGLLVLLDALGATVTGQTPQRRAYEPEPPTSGHRVTGVATPQFEVMYLISGCGAEAVDRLRASLASLGDSVALASLGDSVALASLGDSVALASLGDSVALASPGDSVAPASPGDSVALAAHGTDYSVHVHTDDAGAAVEVGLAAGLVSRIRISVLAGGRAAPGGWSRQRAVLAVVDGDGAEQLFGAEGACVVRPDVGPDDPVDGVSAERLLRALVDTGAASVMVLPNGYVSAEDLVAGCTAAIGWGIDVVPLPAGSMVQGLAALAVHDPDHHAVDDGYAMAQAAAGSRHGSVRMATAEALTWAGTCEAGDGLGIAGDEVVVVAGDAGSAATRLIDLLLGSGGELVTVLIGAGAVDGEALAGLLADHVYRRHPGTEFSSYRTGHRGDVLLIGVE